jgi:hypothetical protein
MRVVLRSVTDGFVQENGGGAVAPDQWRRGMRSGGCNRHPAALIAQREQIAKKLRVARNDRHAADGDRHRRLAHDDAADATGGGDEAHARIFVNVLAQRVELFVARPHELRVERVAGENPGAFAARGAVRQAPLDEPAVDPQLVARGDREVSVS